MGSRMPTSTKKIPAKKKSTPAEIVGRQLKAFRMKKKLSLRVLAEEAKLSYEAVRLVETGRGGFRALSKILHALKLTKPQKQGLLALYSLTLD